MARGLKEKLLFIIIFCMIFYQCSKLSQSLPTELGTGEQQAEAVAGVSSFQSGGSEESQGSRCEECQLIARLARERNPEMLLNQIKGHQK